MDVYEKHICTSNTEENSSVMQITQNESINANKCLGTMGKPLGRRTCQISEINCRR